MTAIGIFGLGSAGALACRFRRLAEIIFDLKVRNREGAIASRRGACAPQTN